MVGWLVGETVLYSILSRFPEEGGGKAMGDGEREVEKRGMIAGKNKYPNNTTAPATSTVGPCPTTIKIIWTPRY